MEKCFAKRDQGCSVLYENKCKDIGCSFYKSKARNNADRMNAATRIRSLDESQQRHISDKHYGGNL